jgi:cytidylate kinase
VVPNEDGELLPENPNEGCFLCSPEAWRVIFTGEHVRVVAGLGPICPGYILVAPKAHVATSADLDTVTRREFFAVCDIVKHALHAQYGSGYTAYEHAKLGSCRLLEEKKDTSHFCFHCHRVFVPVMPDVGERVREFFSESRAISSPDDIVGLAGMQYVYHEVGTVAGVSSATAYLEHKGVPSQFMRRILMPELGLSRDPNWALRHDLETVISTLAALRIEFSGLQPTTVAQAVLRAGHGQRVVSIDGLTGAGKTSVGRLLHRMLGFTLVDSGLVIRRLAAVKLGAPEPTNTELQRLVVEGDLVGSLPRGPDSAAVVRQTAQEPSARNRMKETVAAAVAAGAAGSIVLGRTAWQLVPDQATRLVLSADLSTRSRRRLLALAQTNASLPSLHEVVEALRIADEYDQTLLPPRTVQHTIIDNGRRPLALAAEDAMRVLYTT